MIAALFIQSALPKITRNRQEIAASTAHHIPAAETLVPLAGLCEPVGAGMLIVGVGARIAMALLALFHGGYDRPLPDGAHFSAARGAQAFAFSGLKTLPGGAAVAWSLAVRANSGIEMLRTICPRPQYRRPWIEAV
jgi:hypothetical protein